jgi:hypothetical protein
VSRLPGNEQLRSESGLPLCSLLDINALPSPQKVRLYAGLIPSRLFSLLDISPQTFLGPDGRRRVSIIAPQGMSLARIEVRHRPEDRRSTFFLDIAETHYRQMELSFCIINDPFAPNFAVDVDENGRDNCFTTAGRNIPEEIRAMRAGLFPNQTSRGLRMFPEFFRPFERFVDGLGMDIILAEPLTYDNAIRYEKYGFDYLYGRRLMLEICHEFRPGGTLFRKLDGSSPFRLPGMDRTVLGRSWAIHDGILAETAKSLPENAILAQPWEDVRIYKSIGVDAGMVTFRDPGGTQDDPAGAM